MENERGERNTLCVIILTLVMMAGEIVAGMAFGSMALLADGWHMGTHAAALGITAFAYGYARRHAENPRFAFGTGKVGSLGGYTSAVVLGVVALLMIVESIKRLITPTPIHFNEAIVVAVIGLAVNLISAVMLGGDHHHDHGDDHAHHHHQDDNGGHLHEDLNLKAAYLHVLADALTSVLAIIALVVGKYFGWVAFDPIIGIVGALVISKWAHGLLRDTAGVLLDRDVDADTVSAIQDAIESDADNRIVDFHLWKPGNGSLAAIISVVTHYPRPPEHYKRLLAGFDFIAHVTVEVIPCEGEPCLPH